MTNRLQRSTGQEPYVESPSIRTGGRLSKWVERQHMMMDKLKRYRRMAEDPTFSRSGMHDHAAPLKRFKRPIAWRGTDWDQQSVGKQDYSARTLVRKSFRPGDHLIRKREGWVGYMFKQSFWDYHFFPERGRVGGGGGRFAGFLLLMQFISNEPGIGQIPA